MLVVVVLERLGDPDRGQPRFHERHVVAAAAEAVATEDQPHPAWGRQLVEPARHLPAGRVDAVGSPFAEDARPAVLRVVPAP